MKHMKHYWLALVMMMTMIAFGMTAYAYVETEWGELYLTKKDITVLSTKPSTNPYIDSTCYTDIFDSWEGEEVTCVSSNPDVAGIELNKHGVDNSCVQASFIAKKPGTAVITSTVKYNGVVYTYTTNVTVQKWTNPVKTFKIGSTNFASQFKYRDMFARKQKANGVLEVVPAKNWKITSMKALSNGRTKKIKNGAKIEQPKGSEYCLYVTLQNKKTKETRKLTLLFYFSA